MKSETKVANLVDYYESRRDTLIKNLSRRAGGLVNAEDVVQEAFTRALEYIDSYNPEGSLEAWFNSILMNSLRAFHNEERNQGRVRNSPQLELFEDLEERAERERKVEEVMEIIDGLREPMRTIVQRFVVAGESAKVLARELNISRRSVNQAVYRFVESMRKAGSL